MIYEGQDPVSKASPPRRAMALAIRVGEEDLDNCEICREIAAGRNPIEAIQTGIAKGATNAFTILVQTREGACP